MLKTFFSIFPFLKVNMTSILDYTFGAILAITAIILGFKYFKYSFKVLFIAVGILIVLTLSYIFNLPFIRIILGAIGFVYAIILLISLDKSARDNFVHQHKKDIKKTISKSENDYTESLIAKLSKAVFDLSASKTGALITIQMENDLTPYLKTSGVRVDAPVSAELLETIFVNKTPLHDGAVIIHGNYIVAASVFYQPTQQPLTGKYGSRHRAAIGISEVCDAVTIVVSEETGKVSFAIQGELIPVPVANFSEKLRNIFQKNNI